MEPLDKLVGLELNWSLVKGVGMVLHASGSNEEIATLLIQGAFGSKAEGKCGQDSWKFKRAGLLQNNITIMESNSNQEIAQFKKKGMGGILTMKNGKSFIIERNALMTEYKILLDRTPVLTYRFDKHSQMHIQEASVGLFELPLLLVFLAYLINMQRVDANSALPF
jgi:hypothetical protein